MFESKSFYKVLWWKFSKKNLRFGLVITGINGIELKRDKNYVVDTYRTHAIISCSLYIYYSIFDIHYFVFKEGFSESYVIMYGLYTRVFYSPEQLWRMYSI